MVCYRVLFFILDVFVIEILGLVIHSFNLIFVTYYGMLIKILCEGTNEFTARIDIEFERTPFRLKILGEKRCICQPNFFLIKKIKYTT